VLDAQETSFEEALPQLRVSAATQQATEFVLEQIEVVDDLLAGGATVEDVSKETDLELGEIEWHPDVNTGPSALPRFNTLAQAISVDDFPEVEQLDDGSIITLQLDEVLPPTLRPLDEVREQVERAWDNMQIAKLLSEKVAPNVEQLRNGASFEESELPLTSSEMITRRGIINEAPAEFVEIVFGMEEGDVRIIEGSGRIFVLRVASIEGPDPEDDDLSELLDIVDNQAVAGLANDYFNVLITEFGRDAEVTINDAALQAVHTNFQ
ncbi:MAG: peptidyl-prolyl cis-trans isomerase, partial [Pseudomonadota bacterium]